VTIAGAAALTAWAAVIGLSKWRRELKGKTEFDFGFDLAKATYRLRDELKGLPLTLVSGSEFPAGSDMLASSQDPQVWVHVFQNDGRRLPTFFRSLIRARSPPKLFGARAVRSKTDELRKCVWELYASMQSFIENKAAEGEISELIQHSPKKYARLFFRREVKTIPWINESNRAIEGIEEQVRPHLRRY
jgi:hypothetical protein